MTLSDAGVCFARARAHRSGLRLCRTAPAGSILRDVLGWKYVAEDWDNAA
jgi:hypothetical protein